MGTAGTICSWVCREAPSAGWMTLVIFGERASLMIFPSDDSVPSLSIFRVRPLRSSWRLVIGGRLESAFRVKKLDLDPSEVTLYPPVYQHLVARAVFRVKEFIAQCPGLTNN